MKRWLWLIGAHVTDTSLKESIALADHAQQAGFDLLIIAPSYMVTKTEDQVVEFVREVADNTDLAMMFYNSPQFGITISPQGLKRLCGHFQSWFGVKEASFNSRSHRETCWSGATPSSAHRTSGFSTRPGSWDSTSR